MRENRNFAGVIVRTMILSMTGYGKAVAIFNGKKICVEVRSLNSKSLDLSTHIAPLYREREADIRARIAQCLQRGKVDFTLSLERDAQHAPSLINVPLMQAYFQQLRKLDGHIACAPISQYVDTLLRLPDVVTPACEEEDVTPEEWTAVVAAIDEALEQLTQFRQQEGAALQRKFTEKLDNIERLWRELEPYEASRVEKIRARISEGLQRISGVDYDQGRLEQEMIYYIEKLDISEEKQRLANHLRYFRETMDAPAPQGKKLGFIAQEMGREINTTGSKSNQAEMQNIVVQAKDELEQIKEQVLNVL